MGGFLCEDLAHLLGGTLKIIVYNYLLASKLQKEINLNNKKNKGDGGKYINSTITLISWIRNYLILLYKH